MSNIKQEANKIHWAESAAIFYIVLPVFLFFAFFVTVPIAVLACLLMVFCCASIAKRTNWILLTAVSRRTIFVLVLAAFWLWLAGSLGHLKQNSDWTKHYAFVNFLAENTWPSNIRVDGVSEDWGVRYYIAFYLIPAFILKHTSFGSPRLVTGLWSLLGLFLFFRILVEECKTLRSIILLPFVFMLFGGADLVGRLFTHYQRPLIFHFEWWAGWIAYDSNTTSLFWVPQHALSAWLGVALFLRQADRPTALPYLALVVACLCLWSPFSAIGLMPFVIVLIHRHGIRPLALRFEPIAAAVLIAFPIAVYLTLRAGDLPHGFTASAVNRCIWTDGPCFSIENYLLFVMVEFAFPVAILAVSMKKHRAFLWAAVITLLLIPFYKLGSANDFAMRTSTPSLALLAIYAGRLISNSMTKAAGAMLIVLAMGVPTAMGEVARPFTRGQVDLGDNQNLATFLKGDPELLPQYFVKLPIWVLRNTHDDAVHP